MLRATDTKEMLDLFFEDQISTSDARTDLKQVLAGHLECVLEMLQHNFNQSAAVASRQRDYYNALEVTNAQLHTEIDTLREELARAGRTPHDHADFITGGTGEFCASGSVLQSRDCVNESSATKGAAVPSEIPVLPRGTGDSHADRCDHQSPKGPIDSRAAEGVDVPSEIPLSPLVPTLSKNTVVGECTVVIPGTAPELVKASSLHMASSLHTLDRAKGEPHIHSMHARMTEFDVQAHASDGGTPPKWSKLDDFARGMKKTQIRRKAVFADVNIMKVKIKEGLQKPEYNVAMYYKDSGVFQRIARSLFFETVTMTVIAVNAVWIAIDADYNTASTPLEAHVGFLVVDNCFCFFFVFEWICRFMAFKSKRNCVRDFWFMFDSFMLIVMVFETWVTPMLVVVFAEPSAGVSNGGILKLLRVLRLSRMARMARVLMAVPEIMIIVKGINLAIRTVIFTLVFFVLVVYVFAVVMVELIGPRGYFETTQVGLTHFSDILTAMNTLVLNTALPDQAPLVNELGSINLVLYFIIMVFMVVAGITLMNMIVGVLCEVVSMVSVVERETMLLTYVKSQLQQMLQATGMDSDDDCHISKSKFEVLLGNPLAARALADIGVDVVGLVDFTEYIFKDGVDLPFADFMDIMLELRGSNTATVKNIVDLRKMLASELSDVKEAVSHAYASRKENVRSQVSLPGVYQPP